MTYPKGSDYQQPSAGIIPPVGTATGGIAFHVPINRSLEVGPLAKVSSPQKEPVRPLDVGALQYQGDALLRTGVQTARKPLQRQIMAEVLTIEEIWDILLMALPRHGRRFPLFGGELLAPPIKKGGGCNGYMDGAFRLLYAHCRNYRPGKTG